jgi:hypothetical protein
MIENAYIVIPCAVLAVGVIVVGIIYLVLGTVEWVFGKDSRVTYVHTTQSDDSSTTDRAVKRLEEIATLERNARLNSENK